MKTAAATRRHLLALTFVSMLGLSACGGGGGDSGPSWAEISGSNAVQALKTTDTLAGTGAEALNGKRLTVHYTGWLYDVRATNQKGSQFDSSVGKAPITFTLGAGGVIQGWDKGYAGMKAGGKRTLLIPATQGYGAQGDGSGRVPANAALIFEVELVSVQ